MHMDKQGATAGCVRARAIVIGLLMIPPNSLWVILMEKVCGGPYPTVVSIFVNCVFVLTLMVAANSLVRRVRPEWALGTAELLLIYAMLTIATALCGHDMLPTLVAQMSWPWWYDSETQRYAEFIHALPSGLSVTDLEVIRPLYSGKSSLYAHGHWMPWIRPSLLWVSFTVSVVFVLMCINTLVRKQWMEHERLTFPIVMLPLAMTEPQGSMWRSRLFWIAFGITFGIELLNGLHFYFPSIPGFNLTERDRDLAQGLTALPWSAIGWMPISFYPFVIGLGYLLPADLSFSVWFFYLFWKVEKVAAATMGMQPHWDMPYIRHQSFGGAIAILAMLVYTSRSFFRQVWRRAIGRDSGMDDSGEPMSYRTAVIGGGLALAYAVVFLGRIGMSPLVALAAFAVYFAIAVVVARIRAELGPPVHDMPFGPDLILPSAVGVGRFSQGDLVGLAYFPAFHSANRAHPMPIGLEGMKMAQATGAGQRKFLWAMMAAVALGATATFWAYLHLGYKYGLVAEWRRSAAWAWEICRRVEIWWNPTAEAAAPQWGANAAMAGGFVFCLLLSIVRLKVFYWPFHPIGYVVSGTYQANLVWVPLLIAWTAKVSILRYGGLKMFRAALPLFFGLIIGQLSMGCLWGIIGITFGIPYHNFFAE